MPKNIIFCADGTWGGPAERPGLSRLDLDDRDADQDRSDITNVLKLYSRLKGEATDASTPLSNEQERILREGGKVVQVAKYLHGVGDSSNILLRVLGGTFGFGIIARIVRGYTFISRWYEPGDAIHIVGFSRGAYTARALAGMIAKVGLLNRAAYEPNNEMEAYRLGVLAWSRARTVSLTGANRLTALANSVIGVAQGFFGNQLPSNALIPDVKLKSVAVWDTVGSLGIPTYAGDHRYDVFRFTDENLSDRVEFGFHAMAIDERRIDFPVTRWNDRAGITQAWFVGAHSDVGGGNKPAESGLSNVALQWMIRKLSGAGVKFADGAADHIEVPADFPAIQKPWESLPFSKLGKSDRAVLAADLLHPSVKARWEKANPQYRPTSMGPFIAGGLGAAKFDQ
ncbi:MAG TPA: DUF2235 domain-containing protein [Burkholderiales bacterium]|nr:DUF2235 domain-containing protein [Burkholderiales bacterium]